MSKNISNAFDNDAYQEETKLYNEFLDQVKEHDYSYMMSDSHSVYMSGRSVEKQIEEKLHALINICRYAADDLLDTIMLFWEGLFSDRKLIH